MHSALLNQGPCTSRVKPECEHVTSSVSKLKWSEAKVRLDMVLKRGKANSASNPKLKYWKTLESSSWMMLERSKWRQVVLGLGLLLWTCSTFGHFFLAAPQTIQSRPRPAAAPVMERTRSLLSQDEDEDEVEDNEEDEAGRYEAWWQEQLERRVRVAETCVRCSLLVVLLPFQTEDPTTPSNMTRTYAQKHLYSFDFFGWIFRHPLTQPKQFDTLQINSCTLSLSFNTYAHLSNIVRNILSTNIRFWHFYFHLQRGDEHESWQEHFPLRPRSSSPILQKRKGVWCSQWTDPFICIQLQTHSQAGGGHKARCLQMSTAVHIYFKIY